MKSIAGNRLIVLAPFLAALVMMLPHWPGLIDLPGHVARYHVELDLQHDPLLQRYYQFHWHLIPNLGIDLLVYPLARLFGLNLGVRLCVALIPAIAVSGMLALAYVAHRRIPATSLIALPCAFAYPLVFGFVNYCFSAALALVAAAIWLRLTLTGRSAWRLAFGLIVSPILLIAHLTGWGAFGLTAFGMVFAAHRGEGLRPAVIAAVLACLPLVWPLVVLMTMSRDHPGATYGLFDLQSIARSSIGVLREQSAVIDIASAAVLFLTALSPIIARRRFAYEPVLLIPAVLVWIAVLSLPSVMLGSDFANVRLIPIALALTILAVRPIAPLPAAAMVAAAGFFVFRLAVTAWALLHFDAIAERQLLALDHVTPGSRVLAFKMHPCARSWAPPRSQNLNLLATTERDALTTGHFTESGAQLLSIIYPAGSDPAQFGNSIMAEPCLRWRRPTLPQAIATARLNAFDYVWLIDVPDRQLPQDHRLKLIWRDIGSTLYAVDRSSIVSPSIRSGPLG